MIKWENFFTLQNLIANLLEPIAYLVYLSAISIYSKKKRNLNSQLLVTYFSLAFLLMLTGSAIVLMKLGPNIWLYNLNAIATIGLLGWYFRNLFLAPLKKRVVTVLMTAVGLYLLVKNLVLQQFQYFDSIGYCLVAIFIIVCVFMYFQQMLNNVSELNIFDDFNFWLTSSFLIYFSGNFIIFLTYYYFTAKILATYTLEERAILTNLWGLHNCLLFVGALLLLTGSLCITYRKKSALLH